jgi:hypothetical protein
VTKILISAETESHVTRARDPNDSWDQGDTAGSVTNVWACVETEKETQRWFGESTVVELPVKPGDVIFAVVADYESGSTFGRSGGHAAILDAFLTRDEAEQLARAAAVAKTADWYFSFGGREYYRTWEGYFERLQSLDVWEIQVRGEYQSFLTPEEQRTTGCKRGT